MTPLPSDAPPSSSGPASPVVEMHGITVEFPGVRALDSVDFRMLPGEIHALMGENGAGKSTLIKALTGVNPITAGTIAVEGRRTSFAGPADARRRGISTVYQEVNLCENLTVAENIMLGAEPRRLGGIDWRRMRRQARGHLERMGLAIDPGSSLGSHSLAIQQLVAISRAMVVDAKVLVLDEPTSSLDADEVEQLFAVMRRLRADGVAILFVSHFLDQVYAVADRMTVLRNGRFIEERATDALPQRELVTLMIGSSAGLPAREDDAEQSAAAAAGPPEESPDSSSAGSAESRAAAGDPGDPGGPGDPGDPGDGVGAPPVLAAAGLGRRGSVQPVDLTLHAGEVVGLAGLLGSGRTELARLLCGADRPDAGTLRIDGVERRLRSPRAALARRIAYTSEDRKGEGVVGDLTVAENIVLGLQAARGWMRPLPRRTADEVVDRYMEALGVRPADPDVPLKNLSGGNQQKVLLARWLATSPRLLLLDEPTRGIDIGAKAEIMRLVDRLADDGMAVVFISAELEEVLRLSVRVAVMRDRRKIAELDEVSAVSVDDVVGLIARDPGPHAESTAEPGDGAGTKEAVA